LRIGEFTDTFLPITDGVGRVVYNYAFFLSKKGHECYVIAPMNKTGFRGGYPFELIEFTSKILPGIGQYRTGIPMLDKHFNSRMEMINMDIIHVHSPFSAGIAGARLAFKRNLPLVGTFHSKYYDDFLQITKMESLATLGTKYVVDFYNRCDEVWTMSNSSAETLKSYGFKGNIKIIPNGTDIGEVDEEDIKEINSVYHLNQDKPVLLFVGQMNWKKNILRIIEAAVLLRKEGKSFYLVFAGQGPHFEEIKQKVFELGLQESTVFTGHITDMHILNALYCRASVFVFPSLYDTSGLVTREAAAMGTPSVVIKNSCAAESIQDVKNGFLCEDSTDALFNLLNKIMYMPNLLHTIGENAKKTLPLEWSRVLDQVVDNYDVLIAKNSIFDKRVIPASEKNQP